MKEKRIPLLLTVLLIFIVTGTMLIRKIDKDRKSDNPEPKQPQTLVLDTIKPESATFIVPENYIGQVRAINEVVILPQVSGYIERINVKGGENVRQNDVLMVIEQSSYKAELDSALADNFAAKAEMVYAKRQYERLKKAGSEAVSISELENAGTTYLKSLGTYKQTSAAVEKASTDYNHTILRAPFNGVIGNINPSPGDYVNPQSSPLLTVVQYNPIHVVFSVTDKEYLSENNGNMIYAENKIKLRLPNGKIFDNIGKVKYTDNTLNSQTDSLAIYAEFSNQNQELLPNAYVDVMVEKKYDNAISINKNLVTNEDGGKSVYVLQNGIIKKKYVDILSENENHYILKNDFTVDEMLITQKIEPRYAGHKAVSKIEKQEGE